MFFSRSAEKFEGSPFIIVRSSCTWTFIFFALAPRKSVGGSRLGMRFHVCHGQKSRFVGDGKPPTFNRNPYNGAL